MNAITKAVSNAFASFAMDVSTKIANKFSKVGEVTIHCPTLDSLDQPFERMIDAQGNEVMEDGLPVYKLDQHNWVQGAILAQVKAQARNKLVSKTATLKEGATIATDWASLTAEGERGGNGDALAARREVINLFAAYVKNLQKSDKAQDTLNQLFKNAASLSLQSVENKGKMEAYVSDFAATLTDEQTARYMKYLESISAACEETTEADDF